MASSRMTSMFSNVRPAMPRGDTPVCAVAVDAEEDFDWRSPIRGVEYSTSCMKNTTTLRDILRAYRAVPTYLLSYPVLENADALGTVRRQFDRGDCAVGAQLHPWVNPPFDEAAGPGAFYSYSGNLEPGLEERKLVALMRRITECFGEEPRIYRAGRYGLGRETPSLLEKLGFTIDTSVAPRTKFSADGGPDYAGHDYRPFWFGDRSRILGLPLCRSVVGWAGPLAPGLYRALSAPAFARLRAPAVLTRSRCAERITLSPEGNDVASMIRLVRRLYEGGQRIFVLSFHSSSLAVGRNPYVRSKAELHGFFDRLSAILDHMATRQGMRFASLAEIPAYLEAPGP